MDNRNQIEKSLIETFKSLCTKITFFGPGGILRSIFASVAAILDELFYDLNRIKRKLFIATASGDDLDDLAADHDLTRLTSTKAGVVLVFSGTASTVIPAETEVRSSTGIMFKTKNQITLGEANPPYDFYPSEPLGDKVEAEATTAGESGNVEANTVTELVSAISGVDSVTNPAQAQGGRDAEPDNEFRVRIFERVSVLNQGTQAFYESIAKEIDEDILRAHAERGATAREVDLYVCNRGGVGFSSSELDIIKDAILSYVPMMSNLKVKNMTFTDVDVYVRISLVSGYELEGVFNSICQNLTELIDWSKLDFGCTVQDDDILSTINDTEGVHDIDMSTFQPDSNVIVASNSLPRLGTVTVINIDNNDSINYQPLTSYIY
jgi:uncharacterized phage protein gp47/JayE